jgi:hypothetical protein
MKTRSPIGGDILQIEYAWLVVEHERLVNKLGVCCMSPEEFSRSLAVVERCRAMALPSALGSARAANAIDITVDVATGHVVELGGKPWSAGMPDRRR